MKLARAVFKPSRVRLCIYLLAFVATCGNAAGAKKPGAPIPLSQANVTPLWPVKPQLTAAVSCTTSSINDPKVYITGWVTGNELYKAYIDPGADCGDAYPYTITSVGMPMWFGAARNLAVAVDIEDAVEANCGGPGPMRAVSTDYTLSIPSPGLY